MILCIPNGNMTEEVNIQEPALNICFQSAAEHSLSSFLTGQILKFLSTRHSYTKRWYVTGAIFAVTLNSFKLTFSSKSGCCPPLYDPTLTYPGGIWTPCPCSIYISENNRVFSLTSKRTTLSLSFPFVFFTDTTLDIHVDLWSDAATREGSLYMFLIFFVIEGGILYKSIATIWKQDSAANRRSS